MSQDLPAGFEVQSAAPTGKAAVPVAPPGNLPEGFTTEGSSPKIQSVVPHLVDQFKEGVSDLASLAGAPVSAVNQFLSSKDEEFNKRTGSTGRHLSSDKPLGGMESVKQGWDQLLGQHHTPAPKDLFDGVSKANEYLGAIARFAGGSFFPGVGAVASASRKLATATVIAVGDISAATSSVELKKVGGNLASTFGLTKEEGETIGTTLGAFAGPVGAAKAGQALLKTYGMAAQGLKSADITGFSKEAQATAASSLLMKDLQNALEHAPNSQANLLRSLELSKKIPGWSPTGAQASGAPGLIAMQKEVANKSAEALAKAAAADERNLAAIKAQTDKLFPSVKKQTIMDPQTGRTVTVDPVLDPARTKLAVNKQVMQLQIDKNARDLAALTNQYRRTADNQQIGDKLRSLYWSARDTAKIQQGVALADVYKTARTAGVKLDMTDIRDSVKKLTDMDRNLFQDMPPLFQKISQEYPSATAAQVTRVPVTGAGSKKPIFRTETTPANAGNSSASFEEAHSLYKEANKAWADATMAGDTTKAHYMDMIRQQLKSKVDKFAGPEYGELGAKFTEFNKGYAKYAQTFKEGAGGEIAKRTRAGLSTDAEEIVTKVFLQSGDKKKGIQDFFAIHGNDAGAASLLHDGIVDSFSRAAVKNGSLDKNAAAGWMKQHETALAQLPTLQKKLGDTTAMTKELVNRQLLLQKQRKVLDSTVLAKISQSSNSEALIMQALKDTNQGAKVLKGLLVGAQSPEGKASVARAIVDVVMKNPRNLEYIMENEAMLKPVMESLGKGHWENLKEIGQMEQIAGRVKAPTSVELSKLQDVGEQHAGTSVKGLFARAMAAKQGRISEGYAVMDVGGRWFYKIRSEEMTRLREAAVFDPETAKLLSTLGKQKTAPTKTQLLDLQRLSFNAGAVGSVEAVAGMKEGKGEK